MTEDDHATPLSERNRFIIAERVGWPEGLAQETHEIQMAFPRWNVWFDDSRYWPERGQWYTARWELQHLGEPADARARTGDELVELMTAEQARLEAEEERVRRWNASIWERTA